MRTGPFSPEEEALMYERYANTSTKELACLLYRKPASIVAKAYTMGLRKRSSYSPPESGRLSYSGGRISYPAPGVLVHRRR